MIPVYSKATIIKGVRVKGTMPYKGALTTEDWVRHLKDQAAHTEEHRHTLYEKVNIHNKMNILDVGCGTGVITADIASLTKGRVTGIDIDCKKLDRAKPLVSDRITLLEADASHLPFKDETFDLAVFSVVLMHIQDKQKAVNEMARVTQKNGIVLATMEPDHGGALYYPENKMYPFFIKDVEEMGSDPYIGRKLKYLFGKAGLKTEIGMYTYDFDSMNNNKEQLKDFLNRFWIAEKLFLKNGWTQQQIHNYKREQIHLIENDLYFSFLPVFYAIGTKG